MESLNTGYDKADVKLSHSNKYKKYDNIDYIFVVVCCSFYFGFVSLLYINFCLCVTYVCLWEKGVLTNYLLRCVVCFVVVVPRSFAWCIFSFYLCLQSGMCLFVGEGSIDSSPK